MRPEAAPRRGEKGIAVMMVVLVLAALLAIAGPFALSMYLYERSARHFRDSARARLAAEGAVAHAVAVLRRTEDEAEKSGRFGPPWNTPDYDSAEEFDVRFEFPDKPAGALRSAGVSFDDPKGVIWSVRVEDEQGKINIVSAPPLLLGNLIGSASLEGDLAPGATAAVVDDASFFYSDENPKTEDGKVNFGIGRNLAVYTNASGTALEGLRWLDPEDASRTFKAGTVVYDGAALDITDAAFQGHFRTLHDIKGMLAPHPQDFERLEPCITVHSHRDSGTGWFRREEIKDQFTSLTDSFTVRDVEGLGAGTRVRFLVDGVPTGSMNRIIRARQAGQSGHFTLETPIGFDRPQNVTVQVEGEQRHPVNVNTASRAVLAACFTGVGFEQRSSVRRAEAEAMADFVYAYVRGELGGRPCASAADVKAMLEAFRSSSPAAQGLTRRKIDALIENATIMNSPRLACSTTTFCYKSFGNFTIEAAGIVNTPAGEESARFVQRTLLTMPVASGGRWVLSSQKDFDEQLGRTIGRKVVTWPFLEPPRNPEQAAKYMQGLDPRTGEDRYGYVTLGTGRSGEIGRDGFVDHLERGQARVFQGAMELTHDGAQVPGPLQAEGSRLFEIDQSTGFCKPFFMDMWVRLDGPAGASRALFRAGDPNRGGARLTYEPAGPHGPGLVLTVGDSCAGAGTQRWLGPAEFRFPGWVLAPGDWYHVGFQVKGTAPGDAQVWVDGVPTPSDPPIYRPGTRLSTGLAATASDDELVDGISVFVESTADFPPNGAIIVDGEVMEYQSKTPGSFEKTRRARRYTRLAPHSGGMAGAIVSPYGYSVELDDELFPSEAEVASELGPGPAGMQQFFGPQTTLIEKLIDDPNNPGTQVPDLLSPSAPSIPVVDASNFQDSGFVWIEGRTHPAGQPGPKDKARNARECVYYGRVDRRANELRDCSPLPLDQRISGIGQGGSAREFLLDGEVIVRQISIAIRDFAPFARIVRQTEVDNADTPYFCIKDGNSVEWARLAHVEERQTPAGKLYYAMGWMIHRSNPDVWGPMPWWADPGSGRRWRGLLGTGLLKSINDRAKVLPVVRVKGPQCGDEASPRGYEKVTPVRGADAESAPVLITHSHAMEWRAGQSHGFRYRVSLDTLRDGRSYPAGTSRLLKFPSGELARSCPQQVVLGVGPGAVDEVRGRRGGARTAVLAHLPQPLAPDATSIEIVCDSARNSSFSPSGGGVGAPEAPAHGVAKIDDEFIYFGSTAQGQQVTVPWGKNQRDTGSTNVKICGPTAADARKMDSRVLGDCVRGILGSSKAAHNAGARVVFLENFPLSRLESGLPPGADHFTVQDPEGFPDEGYALISQFARPFEGEVVGWTRKGLSGCEHFRGRYGTKERDHRSGDLVLCLPFRYWDRYARRYDGAELAYFQASYAARGAQWRSIEWSESGFGGALGGDRSQLRVVCRFDGSPSWDTPPTNRPGGLWEFTGTGEHTFRSVGGGPLAADGIEVRVYFEYLPGAFAHGSNAWKRNVRLENLIVTFGSPLVVRKVDLLDY